MGTIAVSAFAIMVAAATPALGQVGRVVHDSVRSKALAGNLLHEPSTREVLVYLPPSYDQSPGRRYPVLYLLHGFTAQPSLWFGGGYLSGFDLRRSVDSLIGAGAVREFLIVMPDGSTQLGGSGYTSSIANGDWERFVAHDLVEHIDRTYRTFRRASSRGLAGHSMGGYGTFRLCLLRPGVWGAAYALSPGWVRLDSAQVLGSGIDSVFDITTIEQLHRAGISVQALIARAAWVTPNPRRPPFYGDLPIRREGGHVGIDPQVFGRWQGQTVFALTAANPAALRSLRALVFDVGDADQFGLASQARALDTLLTGLHVPHTFQEYHGRHSDHVADRLIHLVLPLFSRVLEFDGAQPH
jgi:enterochelin esterase-like enzyme